MTHLLGRLGKLLQRPFALGVLACLILAGWALWSGGVLDGPVAREVRESSVYVAAEVEVDETAAEQIIGNRRLVVAFLGPDDDLRAGCEQVRRAAAGTLVVLLSFDDDGYDTYGCALLPDHDGENFGRAFAAEMRISQGIDAFDGRPLEALKVMVVNYDLLVRAGTIPDGARTVNPSLPRYLIAGAAVLAVVLGSGVAYAGARRAGRLTAQRLASHEAAADRQQQLSAAVNALAQQLMDLDRQHVFWSHTHVRQYQQLAAEYARLLDRVSGPTSDESTLDQLSQEVEALSQRCQRFARSTARSQAAAGT